MIVINHCWLSSMSVYYNQGLCIRTRRNGLHFNSNYLWYSSLIWCLLSMPELTESADRITDLVSTEHAQTNWVSQQNKNKDLNSGENQLDQHQAASIQSEFSIPLYTFPGCNSVTYKQLLNCNITKLFVICRKTFNWNKNNFPNHL